MKVFNYISNISMPIIILIILINGIKEKKNIFDIFLKGAVEGIEIVLKILPTLIGLFFAIGFLRNSGILDFLINIISPILNFFMIPKEIIPLALLRPISGSASLAIATDIIQQNGVDSFVGKLASVIMGSTETTIYTIAVYTSCVKIKNTRFVLYVALFADFVGIITSLIICKIFFS